MTGPGEGTAWVPTAAHLRAVVFGFGLLVVSVVLGRGHGVVVAAPLAAIAVWSTLTRPLGLPAARGSVTRVTLHEQEQTAWQARFEPVPGARSVVVSHPPGPWLELEPDSGAIQREVEADGPTDVRILLRSTRWGRRTLGAPEVAAYSAWNAWRWGPVTLPPSSITTLPAATRFDAAAPAPHPQGLVGMNRSARPGEGSEFAKVRPFQLGDRLRRIHWPVSARTGALHVTATYADEDSLVVVYLDAFNDIPSTDGASSMDVAVRAAGAIAEHHLRRGDRVGLRVFGSQHVTRVPAGTGRNHLRRLLDSLALIDPGSLRNDDGLTARQGLPSGALVILLTPLLDPAALQQAVTLARRGLTVVVVDTLPAGSGPPEIEDEGEAARAALAWRMRLLERRHEIWRLTSLGIPVVRWAGPGSLDQVLRDLGRRSAAPKAVVR